MSRVIVSNLVSVDGFFEGPNGELDWHVVEDEFFDYAKGVLGSAAALLFGRRTYELMAAFWPGAPRDEIADSMNQLPKLVFSRTIARADWNNTRLVRGEAAEEVARLKEESDKDLVILGSAELVSSLLRAGLIDEYRMIVNPLILGRGRPQFRDGLRRTRLRLSQARALRSGVVILSYDIEGAEALHEH